MRQISDALMLMTTSVLLNAWIMAAIPGNDIGRANQAPLLAGVSVVSDRPQTDTDTHNFTVTMPARSNQRFAKLSLSFTEQNQEKTVAPLRFDLASTKAFMGSPEALGRAIDIKDVWIDETGIFWVEFKAPVPPKTTLTLALKTLKSSPAATYEYSIAAYPETKFPAVFVGDGLLTISKPSL